MHVGGTMLNYLHPLSNSPLCVLFSFPLVAALRVLILTAVTVLYVLALCNEIGVRLTVIWYSDRAWYESTVGVWYVLVLLAGGSVLLGACL